MSCELEISIGRSTVLNSTDFVNADLLDGVDHQLRELPTGRSIVIRLARFDECPSELQTALWRLCRVASEASHRLRFPVHPTKAYLASWS